MLDAWPLHTSEPEEHVTRVRITGAGAANPTNSLARGVTVTRVSAVGKYRITWADAQGDFTGASFAFQATTPSDLKGYTVVFGDYSSTALTLDFWVYDSAGNLDDLEAGWKLNLAISFKRVGSSI